MYMIVVGMVAVPDVITETTLRVVEAVVEGVERV